MNYLNAYDTYQSEMVFGTSELNPKNGENFRNSPVDPNFNPNDYQK